MEVPNASVPQNQYVINNVQQLFALNANLVNFQAKFVVKSLSNEPFLGLVVNQQILDSGQPLQFRNSEQGMFSGEMTQDNNVANNWYLVLKSPKPNQVVVDIQTVPIAPKLEQAQAPQQVARMGGPDTGPTASPGLFSSIFKMANLFKIVLGAGVLSIAYFLVKRFRQSRPMVPLKRSEVAQLVEPPVVQHEAFINPVAPAVVQKVEVPQVNTPNLDAGGSDTASTVEGTSTQAVLGENLLNMIQNLPDLATAPEKN